MHIGRFLLQLEQLVLAHALVLGLHDFAVMVRHAELNLDQLVQIVVDSSRDLINLVAMQHERLLQVLHMLPILLSVSRHHVKVHHVLLLLLLVDDLLMVLSVGGLHVAARLLRL